MSEWVSGLGALAAGLAAGGVVVAAIRDRGAPAVGDGGETLDDLAQAQHFLVERMRELEADRGKLPDDQYRRIRAEIERELADLLRQADRRAEALGSAGVHRCAAVGAVRIAGARDPCALQGARDQGRG